MKRREEREKNPESKRVDFISLLLEDEMFKDNEKYMIDECLTFMIASTQTTSVTLFNLIKNCLLNAGTIDKCKEEIRTSILKGNKPENVEEWIKALTYDNLNDLHYL